MPGLFALLHRVAGLTLQEVCVFQGTRRHREGSVLSILRGGQAEAGWGDATNASLGSGTGVRTHLGGNPQYGPAIVRKGRTKKKCGEV